jgi:hypothetical protein
MRLIALVLCSLVVPGAASAATVGGKTRIREGTHFGTMQYRAGHGVANRVTVKPVVPYGEFKITDRAERLRAKGECRQAGRHSAVCPWTESDFAIQLVTASKSDRVEIQGRVSALVHGGGGNDFLKGNGDELFGDSGRDRLIGGKGWDRLHGGPGRDRMEGRGGSPYLADVFYDDETDAQASRDVMLGGKNARARVDYGMRATGLRIDLHSTRIAPEKDVISGVKGVTGGSGDDVFTGTGGRNDLNGGPGNDRLYGRGGGDWLDGGAGNDAMFGEDGDDRLSDLATPTLADGADDSFVGGNGRDEMHSLEIGEDHWRDRVRCDARDHPVRSDAADKLRGCAKVAGWDIAELEMRVQPQLTADGLEFTLRCGTTESEQLDPSTFKRRCRGTLVVRRSTGYVIGEKDFSFELEDNRTPWVTVTVPISEERRQAVQRGTTIGVEAKASSSNGWTFPAAGYRTHVDL